jgi:hypothetical protein
VRQPETVSTKAVEAERNDSTLLRTSAGGTTLFLLW